MIIRTFNLPTSLFLFICILLFHPSESYAESEVQTIHVITALCDNENQGIVPVPENLGNGTDLRNNLYWGALYGVRTVFDTNDKWDRISKQEDISDEILERLIYKYVADSTTIILIADAYRGDKIKTAITDFIDEITGHNMRMSADNTSDSVQFIRPDLSVYVGHNGLMEFNIVRSGSPELAEFPDAMILCCSSKRYFTRYFDDSSSAIRLWTTGLCSPEAYTLEAALEGWMDGRDRQAIHEKAAQAYNDYQQCGIKAARRLWQVD